MALQQQLAHSLNLPAPEAGWCNIHCGIVVRDGDNLYPIYEYISSQQRIFRQQHYLPVGKRTYYRDKLGKLNIDREPYGYFPVYRFPDCASSLQIPSRYWRASESETCGQAPKAMRDSFRLKRYLKYQRCEPPGLISRYRP